MSVLMVVPDHFFSSGISLVIFVQAADVSLIGCFEYLVCFCCTKLKCYSAIILPSKYLHVYYKATNM